MSWTILAIIDFLFLVAIGVQVYYLQGLKRSGVEVSKATKIVVWVNILLLGGVAVGLAAFVLFGAAMAGR